MRVAITKIYSKRTKRIRKTKITLRKVLLVTLRHDVESALKGGIAMSKYTTGELAKLCNVTVRTVQYYDSRGILVPGELSEGGRRLYTDEDVKRLQTICFLRDAGISINSIGQLFEEENPGSVISMLLEQQEQELQKELDECKEKLHMVEKLKKEVKNTKQFSLEAIGDVAYQMKNKKKLKRLYAIMLFTAIPLEVLEWVTIAVWIATGIWWPFVVHMAVVTVYCIGIGRYYFRKVAYICPECHAIFKPRFKEAFFARHTLTLRKLTCTCCGYHGFCVETYGTEEN